MIDHGGVTKILDDMFLECLNSAFSRWSTDITSLVYHINNRDYIFDKVLTLTHLCQCNVRGGRKFPNGIVSENEIFELGMLVLFDILWTITRITWNRIILSCDF